MSGTMLRSMVTAIVLSTALAGYAGENDRDYIPEISGYASFEAGEVAKGYSSRTGDLKRAWVQTGYAGLRIDADVSERLRILVGGELHFLFSFRRAQNPDINILSARIPKTVFLFKHGEAMYTPLRDEKGNGLLRIEAGFFPYKYNDEVRNLGEYLFRSYCYPTAVLNLFDRPFADLVGLRIGSAPPAGPGHFNFDVILNSSMTNNIMEFWPPMNWHLSLLVDYSIPRLFTVGGGIQWWNLFSVGAANSRNLVGADLTNPDSINTRNRQLSFAGVKLMARGSFDAKGFFPAGTIFGEEDLKLYGEAAILGYKNYVDTISDTLRNRGFNKRSERTPFMLGFNLPAFKLLDVLSIEIEYWNSPYLNSYQATYYDFLPLPGGRMEHNDIKWSIYAKRGIGKHFSLSCQFARDHLIPYTSPNANQFAGKTDVLLDYNHWWWVGKILYRF